MNATDRTATRADVCVAACADAFHGDGEVICSPMGTIPRLGALLAWSSEETDLVISDGEAQLLAAPVPLGAERDAPKEAWLPFRAVFDMVFAGRRHVMMGASQLDRYGNQNISAIGDHEAPDVQLLGARGAPGNTANHETSYWIPNHSPRVFVEAVDFVSGVGTDKAEANAVVGQYHRLQRIITNLAVMDMDGPGRTMRLLTTHPGVTVEDVQAATGFELGIPKEVPTSRVPTDQELAVIDRLDPDGLRYTEVAREEDDA